MNGRLSELIRYKTGGRQVDFAKLLGWTPAYLAKLLRGENFGLQPVLTILSAFPEINARWFLFGQGDMLEVGQMFHLQREAFAHVKSLLDMERFIPVMTPDELRNFEEAIANGKIPHYSESALMEWELRIDARNKEINARVNAAKAKSDELCKRPTAKP